METKDTLSSCSYSDEQDMQQMLKQAKIFKENSLNKLNALKSTTQLLERQTFSGCILYQQAFAQLFGDSVRTFKFQLSQHMNNLETLLNAETLHEMDSKSALSVIKVQFERTDQFIAELKMTLKKLSERQLQIQLVQGSRGVLLQNQVLLITPLEQNLPQNRKQAEIHTNTLTPGMYRIATSTTQNREPQLPHASRNTNPHVSTSTGVNHSTSVSRPLLKSYQVKDKVVPNNSQVKFTKKEVEDHHRISSISKKTKSVTACNDSSNSRTLNVNVVCVECGKCVFNSNHDACVSKYLNVVNARTKKPNVVPIGDSKPKRKANKTVATTHKKTVASDTTIQKPKSYFKELYENTNKAWKWWIEKKCPLEYKWTQTTPSRPSLKWKPTGRIFSNVRLRWIPTGKLFNSCTGKVDSEPTHVSIVDIPHIHASKQTLGLSAGISFNGQKQQRIDLNADALYNEKQENPSARMVSQKMSYIKWRLLKITLQAPFLNVQKTFDRSRSSLGLHGNDLENLSYDPIRTGGSTQGNPKLEIAVLRYDWRRMYMGIMPTKIELTPEQSQQGVSNDILVLGGNYSSTEQVNFIQQLIAYCRITGTEVDIGEIIYSDLVTKLLNKSRLKYVSYPRFISCALQVLLGSDYTQDENFGFLPGILINSNFTKDPSKVTDIELTAHMIAINSQKDSVSPLPLAAKPKKGKSQSMTLTLPKSQGPEAFRALSKKRKRPQDLTSTTSDEGTAKTTPHLEGSLRDKDLERNISPDDIEPIHPTVADISGTGEPSYEGEPDTEPLKLHTFADVQAFLLSKDELEKESDEEEVLAIGEDMYEDIQVVEEVRTPSPKQD
ncbi:hypothetical protein Tco_1456945 [Tanacetum coccineum]